MNGVKAEASGITTPSHPRALWQESSIFGSLEGLGGFGTEPRGSLAVFCYTAET